MTNRTRIEELWAEKGGSGLPPLGGGALKNAFKAYLNIPGTTVTHMAFDKLSGGKALMNEVKYQPAEGVQRTYAGIKTIENVTLEAEYEEAKHGKLLPGQEDTTDIRGLAAEVIVEDLVPGSSPPQYVQNRPPYKGLVLEVTPPDYDSNDASTIVTIGVIISVGSVATG